MKYDKCYWAPDYVGPAPFVSSKIDTEQHIDIDALTNNEKQALWRGIKNNEPELAELMKDETFNEIKKAFGAVHMIEQKKHNDLIDKDR